MSIFILNKMKFRHIFTEFDPKLLSKAVHELFFFSIGTISDNRNTYILSVNVIPKTYNISFKYHWGQPAISRDV